LLLSQHSFLISSHRFASSCCCCWWLRHNRSRACLFACFVCWFVFFRFFGFLWPAPSVSPPPRVGRAVFLYLSSNSLLSSLSLPSHIWLAPWWFGFGFVRCSTRTRWITDLCWRAEEAAPKIRRYVRFWTVVAILLKAVCLSRFPCPLLFFWVVFGYICESCCGYCCSNSHCGLGPCRDHIRASFGTKPVAAAVIKVGRDLGFWHTNSVCNRSNDPAVDDRWFWGHG
jgi:hypothetical protein